MKKNTQNESQYNTKLLENSSKIQLEIIWSFDFMTMCDNCSTFVIFLFHDHV
jgi:hypothetical protein